MKCMHAFVIMVTAATPVFAQVISGPAATLDNRVFYNLNPMPPIVSNNRVQYAPGTAYIDGYGRPKVCNGILNMDGKGRSRVRCEPFIQPASPLSDFTADAYSSLTPAAGGASSQHLRRDSNLSSDVAVELRSDKSFIQTIE
jgi:hypothetical protein